MGQRSAVRKCLRAAAGRPSVRSMVRRLVITAALVVSVSVGTAGCLASGEVSGNEPPDLVPVEPDWEESAAAQVRQFDGTRGIPEVKQPQQLWTCAYSPTYDRDWHNDVLCTNGVVSDRPYLLRGDSYITPDEIERAAHQYEAALNADVRVTQRTPHRAESNSTRLEDLLEDLK